MNVEFISQLLEKRRALYEEAADITVATDGKSVSEICDEIVSELIAYDLRLNKKRIMIKESFCFRNRIIGQKLLLQNY